MAPDPDADGWSIHVPSTGFETVEVEEGEDGPAPTGFQLRAAVQGSEEDAARDSDAPPES